MEGGGRACGANGFGLGLLLYVGTGDTVTCMGDGWYGERPPAPRLIPRPEFRLMLRSMTDGEIPVTWFCAAGNGLRGLVDRLA